jgi:hypothetical protein
MLAQFGPTRSRAVEVLRDFVGERRLLDPAA